MNFLEQRRQKQRMEEEMRIRRSMASFQQGEKKLQALHDQCKDNAVHAEKSNNHAAALLYAAEAGKIKNMQKVNNNLRNQMVTIDAMRGTAQLMADTTSIASDLLKSCQRTLGESNPYEAAATLSVLRDQMDATMEEHTAIFDEAFPAEDNSETGESYLRQLLSTEKKEKPERLIRSTTERLDRLQSLRTPMNERSK